MAVSVKNYKDFNSVNTGRVHNIGAGGVNVLYCITPHTTTDNQRKRFKQWLKRTERAVGNK